MEYLKEVQTDSEVLFGNHLIAYSSKESHKVFIKKHYTIIYEVVTPPSTPTVEWDATSAELSFVGRKIKRYNNGQKPDEILSELEYNFTAKFPQNPLIYPEVNTEMVDLGLPSGTKWAKCNLFAQTETDYGYYFQWADTKGYPTAGITTIDREGVYNWEGHDVAWIVKQKNDGKIFNYNTTPYQTNPTAGTSYANVKFTKYLGSTTSTFKDPSATDEDALKTVLDPEDDAASVHMGEGWRMPTEAQFNELINETNNSWIGADNTEFGGVTGYKFTNKTDASKYIFIPTAGRTQDSSVYSTDSYGHVWSSSLRGNFPNRSWSLIFNSNNVSEYDGYRYDGFSVRGVHL